MLGEWHDDNNDDDDDDDNDDNNDDKTYKIYIEQGQQPQVMSNMVNQITIRIKHPLCSSHTPFVHQTPLFFLKHPLFSSYPHIPHLVKSRPQTLPPVPPQLPTVSQR